MEEVINQTLQQIEEILFYVANPELISPDFFVVWHGVRLFAIIASFALFGLLIYLLSVNDYLKYRFREDYEEYMKSKPFMNVKLKKNWGEILKHSQHSIESERKLAVIEADDALNDIFAQLGYKGENLMQKLEGLTEEIVPNLEELKDAHRKKRDIVYDPNKNLSKDEAKKIISAYEETFKYFQIF